MRVALVSPGLSHRNERLQPHATLLAMARELCGRGIATVAITDGAGDEPVDDELGNVPVRRLRTARTFRWDGEEDGALSLEYKRLAPDIVLWHVSLTTLLHQQQRKLLSAPVLGVLTTPAQTITDILSVGLRKLSTNVDLILPQLLGALVPAPIIRGSVRTGRLDGIICLSEASRRYVIDRGAPTDRVFVVPPSVEPVWLTGSVLPETREALREKAGCGPSDFLLTYFGSPAPVRGIFTLIDAVAQLSARRPQLRLLVLSRRWDDEWAKQERRLTEALQKPPLAGRAHLIDGYLEGRDLHNWIAASDAICLPFELLPSDVPLSVLEAMAAGQVVVTTPVASIPELIDENRGLLSAPRSASALAGTLERVIDGDQEVASMRQRAQEYARGHRRPTDMGDALMRAFAAVGVK